MRPLVLLLAASSVAVAACGGLLGLDDKAYDPALDPALDPASRAGAGGASGGSGYAGAGADQGGAANMSGASGQGGDGQTGGLAGVAGQAGEGGVSGISGQAAAGEAGTAGQSGAGGQGGAGGCTTSSSCPTPTDPCGKAVCNAQGVCEVAPSNVAPPQTEGDCKVRTCEGATSVFVDRTDDIPDPNGQCDVVTCSEQKPVYTPDSSKCTPGFGCQVASCVCLGCPAGELPDKPGQCRFSDKINVLATDDVPDTGPVVRIVDGNLATVWTSSDTSVQGVGHATVTMMLPGPVWMAELILYPQFVPLGQYEGEPVLTVQGSARAPDDTEAFTISVNVTGSKTGEPIEIKAPQTVEVKRIDLTVTTYGSSAALHEVTYRACP